MGTGFFIRPDGVVLTAHHVVEEAERIEVTTENGRRLEATVIAADPRADLAVLHVDSAAPAHLQLGDSAELRQGQLVLAFGRGLEPAEIAPASASLGTVSALGRPLPQELGRSFDRDYGDTIQFSAAVRPGDSGGPLLGLDGRVVGLIVASEGPPGDPGIGCAAPVNARFRAIVSRLMRGDSIDYGYFGVLVGDADEAGDNVADGSGGAPRPFVKVFEVQRGGPADRAGLRRGDRIISVAGTTVGSAHHFTRLAGAVQPGIATDVVFERDSTRRVARVAAAHRPSSKEIAREASSTALQPPRVVAFRGARLDALPAETRQRANLPDAAMLVTHVAGDTPAGRAGLMPGDVVVRVEGQPLDGRAAQALESIDREVLLGLASGGSVLVKPR